MQPQHTGMEPGASQPTTPATPFNDYGVDAMFQAYGHMKEKKKGCFGWLALSQPVKRAGSGDGGRAPPTY